MRLLFAILVGLATGVAEESVDVSSLPRPVERRVDFATDIQPVIDRSCLKCHSQKRPKGGYQITSRNAAIKGGESGVAINPGDSAKSPFVHYIAGLVEDMEMPPEGKAPVLSRAEIALIRGWIDQGARWSSPETQVTVEPYMRWITLDGNASVLRQHWGMTDGTSIGFSQVTVTSETEAGDQVEFDGRYLGGDEDHLTRLYFERPGLGYLEAGYESWRDFGADTGGYLDGMESSPFRLAHGPYLDHGRLWLSTGLAIPHTPRFDFTYEQFSRYGRLATQQWAGVPVGEFDTRSVYPATKLVDEGVDRISLRAEHELGEIQIEDTLTIEFGDTTTGRGHAEFTSLPESEGLPDYLTQIDESNEFKRGANSLRLTRELKDWWHVSLGHHFAKFDSNGSLDVLSLSPGNLSEAPWQGDRSNAIRTKQRSHYLNFTSLMKPAKHLTFSSGVQGESTRQEGFSSGLSLGTSPARFASGLDRTSIEGNAQLKYTGLRHTVLTVGTRLREERTDHREEGHIESDWGADGFMRDSDEEARLAEHRLGFAWSPNTNWMLCGGYLWRDLRSQFDHQLDRGLTDEPGYGYPAFVDFRQGKGDVVNLGVTWRGYAKLVPSFRWERHRTEYRLGTPAFVEPWGGSRHEGGRHLSGEQQSDVFSFSYTSRPMPRLSATTSVGYTDTWTGTIESETLGLHPYEGDVWFYVDHLNYVFNPATDLTFTRSYYRADYGDSNMSGAIAYGLDAERYGITLGLRHRIGEATVFNFQYGWFNNDEPSANGANDYKAHMLLASLSIDLN